MRRRKSQEEKFNHVAFVSSFHEIVVHACLAIHARGQVCMCPRVRVCACVRVRAHVCVPAYLHWTVMSARERDCSCLKQMVKQSVAELCVNFLVFSDLSVINGGSIPIPCDNHP